MIEFVTLLLGLAAGSQVVELSASGDVAEVRLVLDGRQVAVDTEAPWKMQIDLGTRLEPHLLEAVALDREGMELARATQRLNVPRALAEARIALERDQDGVVLAAHVTWETSILSPPRQARAWFDGTPLVVTDAKRIPIPAHDKSRFHFLQVELEFSPEVSANAQATFGGVYRDESRAELTAFAVITRRNTRSIDPAQMSGWFRQSGEELPVSAFEKGELDLVLVSGPEVAAAIGRLEATPGRTVWGGTLLGVDDAESAVEEASKRLRRSIAFGEGRRLRVLAPSAGVRHGHTVGMRLFALSPEITDEHGGLYSAIRAEVGQSSLASKLLLADAVAVAALQASSANRRRGVLLILADAARDDSRHRPQQVRDYLTSIQVPLFVWRIGRTAQTRWKEWGEGEHVTSFPQLQRAARRLDEALERQRIVWLDGLYLPHEIEISENTKLRPVSR